MLNTASAHNARHVESETCVLTVLNINCKMLDNRRKHAEPNHVKTGGVWITRFYFLLKKKNKPYKLSPSAIVRLLYVLCNRGVQNQESLN